MNKQYIKRQITLHELGLPMDNDIKEYYDYFLQLIDINVLEELTHDDYPNSIFWRKEGLVIIEYNIKRQEFMVDYPFIWLKFKEKYKKNKEINYQVISSLFGSMLTKTLGLKETRTDSGKSQRGLKLSKKDE